MEGDHFKELNDEVLDDEEGTWMKMTAVSKKLVRALYSCFYTVFSHYNATTRFENISKRHISYYFEVIISALQLQSLYYPSFAALPNWGNYSWFEDMLSVFRMDYLCVKLGLGVAFFTLSLALTLIPLIALITMLIRHYRGSDVKASNYRLTLGLGLNLLRSVLFLPFMCIFVAGMKYSASSSEAYEYSVKDIGLTYFGLSGALGAFILFSIAFLQTIWQYEQLQARSAAVFTARAHSQIEALRVGVVTGLAISKFALHYDFQIAHLSLCILAGCYLGYKYAFFLPYYRPLANFFYGLPWVLLASGGLANLIGYFTGSSATVISLTIIMSIPLAIVYWDLIIRRQETVKYKGIKHFQSIGDVYLCELIIRSQIKQLLADTESNDPKQDAIKQTILDMFNEIHRTFRESRMACIWEFVFAYEALGDESIARLKLSRAVNSEFEWEADYLHFKYTGLLKDYRRQYFEEIDYINFRQHYDAAKSKDHAACKTAMRFWLELSRESPRVDLIERLAIKIYELTNDAKRLLEKLLKEYPKNPLALQLNGSFLLEVFNDTEKGNDLVSKGESERREQEQKSSNVIEQRFSFFDDANAILIVSGDPETIGIITYANHQASEVLGLPGHLLVSTNINVFCPPPIYNNPEHNRYMLRFLERSRSNTVQVPFFSFMLDTYGFLFEVYIQVKCVALEANPFFIAAFRKSPSMREVALYDDNYIIQANTKGFAEMIGSGDVGTQLKGRDLFKELHNLKGENLELGRPFKYLVPNTINTVLMKFDQILFHSKVFKYVHVTNDELEIEDWNNTRTSDIFSKLKTDAPRYRSSFHKKSMLKAPDAPKKGLNVKFNLTPLMYYLEYTDFSPGSKTAVGKIKDATIPVKNEDDEIGDEEQEAEEVDMVDLKNISSLLLTPGGNSTEKHDKEEGSQGSKGKRLRGTSVASSAVSSNSSFTSSAAAQMLLLGVNASIFRFKVSFFVTIVVVLASAIAMLVYLLVVADEFNHKMIILELSDRSVHTSRLAINARILQLINAKEYDASLEQEIRASIRDSCDVLDDIHDKIMHVIEEWESGEHSKMYKDDWVVTWDFQRLDIRESKVNLEDALRKYKSHGRGLFNTLLSDISANNSNFFYLTRNGEGETLKAMNKSVEVFLDDEGKSFVSSMMIIIIIGAAAVVLNIICFVAILLPTLISVERSHQSVWGFFYRLPLDIVQEMRFRSEERLETTHGVELERKSHESEMFKSIENRRSIHSSRKWPGLLLRLIVYYALCTGYFVYFYLQGYDNFLAMFSNHPKVLMWSGLREYAVDSSFFYFQESYLAKKLEDLRYVLPQTSWFSPMTELNDRLWLLDHSELKLQDIVDSTSLSSEHFDLLVDQGYDTRNEMRFGIHSALLDYRTQIRACLAKGKHPRELLDYKFAMQNAVNNLTDLYSDAMSSTLSADKQQIIMVTVLFALSSLFLFFFVYLPMINVVRSEIVEVFELARLIPIELLDRILVAFKKEKNPIVSVQ